MTFSTYSLQVRSRTWNRDSFGLYDYGTYNYEGQTLSITSTGRIAREENLINFSGSKYSVDGSQRQDKEDEYVEEPMISIYETRYGVRIESQDPELEGPNQFWIVVEQEQSSNGYELHLGDVIRFGRVIFRVKQLKIVKKSEENKKSILETLKDQMKVLKAPYILSSIISNQSSKSNRESSKKEKVCKICLSDKADEEEDPMITPCKCTGSVKYVHLKCLQSWVMSKLTTHQSKNVISVYWKRMECELCKEGLPITFIKHGKEFSLLSFDSKITGSYIMMESFCMERNMTGIHLVNLSPNADVSVGRGRKCELKIIDVSISREHACIKLKKGKVYVRDTESKFGTLVLLQKPILLDSAVTSSPWVQWGRTMMKFSLNRKWITYFSCIKNAFQCNDVPSEATLIEFKQSKQKEEEKDNDSVSLRLYCSKK